MKLADAPEPFVKDGALISLTPALLRGDPWLEALFAPFRECVVLHEALLQEGSAARASRLLMAEIRGDGLDDVREIVRSACSREAFEEKPTELDDVAAGTEWRERSGPRSVAAYRLFGSTTALHVTSAKTEPANAPLDALRISPLAIVADEVKATSFVERVSCSRTAGDEPRWHLQARLRDLRRFTEIAPLVVALGFEERHGKYWRERVIVQAVGKERWMAALPGIDFGG